jgi:DNA repair protein RadC
MELKVKAAEKREITSPESAAACLRAVLAMESEVDKNKEHFWTFGLNTRNRVLYVELVTLGLLDQTIVHPREVFRFAIMKGVKSIIIAHNHPSGDCTPSDRDAALTRKMRECGNVLGIHVLDSLVVSDSGYFSYSEAENW